MFQRKSQLLIVSSLGLREMNCVLGWFLHTSQRHLHLHLQEWDWWVGLKSRFCSVDTRQEVKWRPFSSPGGHPWVIGLGGLQWKHGSQVHPSVGFSGSVRLHLPHGSAKVQICSRSCREGFCGHEQQGDIKGVSVEVCLYHLWGSRHQWNSARICASTCSCRRPCLSERCFVLRLLAKENLESGFSAVQ